LNSSPPKAHLSQRSSGTFHHGFKTPRRPASTVQASLHHCLETCMHTNLNRRPAGITYQGRLLWLAPLILALFGCGGGGSDDATDAPTTSTAYSPHRFPSRSPDSGRRS
jgi:hypothetical protein